MKGTKRGYDLFPVILGLFVAILLISDVVAVKVVDVWGVSFAGGTLLFPISYIFGDVFTEVYGYARSRKVIWTGVASTVIMSLMFALVAALPASPSWPNQSAFVSILGQVPRVVFASTIGFFAGEFSNSFILAKMKIRTQGRHLWARTIGSTVVGEALDSGLFVLIAFVGVLPWSVVFQVMLTTYLIKVVIEATMTPVTYRVVHYLKKYEGVDVYDIGTNFNPFTLRDSEGDVA